MCQMLQLTCNLLVGSCKTGPWHLRCMRDGFSAHITDCNFIQCNGAAGWAASSICATLALCSLNQLAV